VPLFLDFLAAASFVEFTDLLGDLLAKFDEGGHLLRQLPHAKKLTMDMRQLGVSVNGTQDDDDDVIAANMRQLGVSVNGGSPMAWRRF
jgi:hypothetical protein